MHGVRLAAGLVWRFGSIGPPPLPASAACSVQPTEVLAGEPVTVTANGSNFNPNRTVRYAWSGTGVKVSGDTATTQVDTTGLAPGSYQVAADLNDGSRSGVATCGASFTVRAPRGPAVTCSANPSTVQVGGSSNITASASSPDSRPLTYSYNATAGNISGTTSSTTLNTEGAAPGSITVNCNVADDRNPALTATAATNVMVEAMAVAPPAPPPALDAAMLNQIDFKTNSPRVDNAAKAILDDVALRLQRDADSRVVLVGLADPAERNSTRLAAERAFNAKTYLVNEKGIDASRIETRTGSAGGQHTQIWLVPAGATFNTQGTEAAEPAARRR
ncbi:MAG: OmpA family protein, partial [Terriglobales bacterium]